MSKLSEDELQALLHSIMPKFYDAPIIEQSTNTEENSITEYVYDSKYISGEAKDIFINFTDRNQYLIKSGTGAGGTTLMLNQLGNSAIIITPNRSQVRNKHSKKYSFECENTFFIWGQSKGKANTWKQVYEAMTSGKQVVVMTVVDAFFHLKKTNPDYYDYFKDCNLIIDECHTTVKENFRGMMSIMYDEVQTWRASVKFSTATPQPNALDIPISMNVEIIKVKSENKLNQIVSYSEDRNDGYKFIERELYYGRTVLVFTNHAKVFNELSATYCGDGGDSPTNIVHISTGKSLKNSTNRFERESDKYKATDIISTLFSAEEEDVKSLEYAMDQPHKRLFILSKAYFAGVDFMRKCSVVVLSDQMFGNCSFDWLDIIQAMGRPRLGFFNILLVNAPCAISKDGIPKQRKGTNWEPYYPTITKDALDDRLLEIGPVDTYKKSIAALDHYNQYLTLNPEARLEQFAEYGYHLEPYVSDDTKSNMNKFKFTDYILNLMTYDEHTLESVIRNEGTYEMRNEIYEDGLKMKLGCIDPQLVLQYYIALILIKYRPQQLIQQLENDTKKKLKLKDYAYDMMQFLLQYLDTEYHNIPFNYEDYNGDIIYDGEPKPTEDMVYEFLSLYGGCEFAKDIYSDEVNRQIRIGVVMGDRVSQYYYYNNGDDRIEHVLRYMKSRLKKPKDFESDEMGDIILTPDEIVYARTNIRRNFEYLDKYHTDRAKYEANCLRNGTPFYSEPPYNINTKASLLKKIRRASLFFFTRGRGTFAEMVRENRTYSPLSSLPKNLRIALFVKFICYDIKSANPSIVCLILGIKNDIPFYHNIKTKCSLGEGEGKVMFNSILNKHFLPKKEAEDFYVKAGFDRSDAIKLANMTAGVAKASMFHTMTFYEAQLIYDFVKTAIDKYPNNLTQDMFYRLHDSSIIAAYHLGDYTLQTEYRNATILFEKSDFNGLGRGEF